MCTSCVIFLVGFSTDLIFLSHSPYSPYTIHLTPSLSHCQALAAKCGIYAALFAQSTYMQVP